MSRDQLYDLVILGGGPAGVSAAIYGARAGLSVIILEKMLIGGRLVSVDRIENYPGFPEGITGPELGLLFDKHLRCFEVRIEAVSYTHLDVYKRQVVIKISLFGTDFDKNPE